MKRKTRPRRPTRSASNALPTVLRSMPEAALLADHAGAVLFLNPAAERLFLLSHADALKGKRSVASLNPALGQWLARANGVWPPRPMQFELAWGAGGVFSVSLTSLPLPRRKRPGWLVALQDVARFKDMEQWRTEAIQMAAHDLRTPLNLMQGATDMLRDSVAAPTPEQREYFEMLKVGAGRMDALIEQLLKLEQVEAGLNLNRARVDLCRLFASVAGEFKLTAEEKGLRLTFEGGPATGPVLGDETWLRRAVANLLSNALKYTPGGGQVQAVYREAEGEAVCEVSDTGPGIPRAAQARLFERFYRVRGETTEAIPGVGLGLAIVKTVIAQHGGRVWVSSEGVPGQGSTFGFAVPIR
jgi:signal transduction histidine kinase